MSDIYIERRYMKNMSKRNSMLVLLLALLAFPSLLHAQFRRSAWLLGANYYNDDPQGVIGDLNGIVGNVPGVNVNITYRNVFSRALFYRIGAGLDIGLPKTVKDSKSGTEYTFKHSRIEVPALLGFSLASGPGHVYGAVGIQLVMYNAALKKSGGTDSGSTEYSLTEVGSAYFLYGMEAPIARGSNGFFEVQFSQASGIGKKTEGDKKDDVQLRPSYIRWNIGINYSF